MALTITFGIELETLIIVPPTSNLINHPRIDRPAEHREISLYYLSLYLAKSRDKENDPKFAFQDSGEIRDPNTLKPHNGEFDRWVVCFDRSVIYPGLAPKKFYTSIGRGGPKEDEKIKTNHRFLLNSTIASMLASPIGWIPLNHTELVSPVLTLGNYSQIDHVFEHLTMQTPPAPMFFHNTTTSTHVHMLIKNGKDNLFMDPMNILKICCAWLSFEPLFFSFVAPWRQSTGYCTSMRELIGPWGTEPYYVCSLIDHYAKRYKDIKDKTNKHHLNELLLTLVSSFQGIIRYAALNLHNLVHINVDDKDQLLFSKETEETGETGAIPLGTIECRILHGTTDKDEIINFVELLSAFFQAAIKSDIGNLKICVEKCWDPSSPELSYLQELRVFLGEQSWIKIGEFCSQRYNAVLSDPNPRKTPKPETPYTYHGIIVDSSVQVGSARTLYIHLKNKRNELIFMGGLNLNIGKSFQIDIIEMNDSVQISLTNNNTVYMKAVVLKRDDAKKMVADLKKYVEVQAAANEEQMSNLMTGGKIYLNNKNLKPLKKFIKTTRRYVGKDKVSRVIYVKGKAFYTKRRSVVGFEYVRIRAPKPIS